MELRAEDVDGVDGGDVMSAQDVMGIVPEGEEKPFGGMPVVGRVTIHLGSGRVDTLAICESDAGNLVFGSGCHAVRDRVAEVLKDVRGSTPEYVAAEYYAWEQQVLHGIARGITTSVAKGYAWDYVPMTRNPPKRTVSALEVARLLVEWANDNRSVNLTGVNKKLGEVVGLARQVVAEAAPKPTKLSDRAKVAVEDERTGAIKWTTWGEWKADLDGGAALVPEDVEPIEQDLLSRGESAFMDKVNDEGILWRMRLVSGGAR
jgi:hypothetical protein